MLAIGTSMLLLIPSKSNHRVLHPGEVIESDSERVVCRFEEAIAPAEGSDVIAFGLMNGQFLQQAVRVIANVPGINTCTIELLRTGEAVSAEQRQAYRVSVVTSDVYARIGKEQACPVIDISAEGFGAIASGDYKLGSSVPVSFTIDKLTIDTTVRVQTARTRPDGTCRYGFLVAEKSNPAKSVEFDEHDDAAKTTAAAGWRGVSGIKGYVGSTAGGQPPPGNRRLLIAGY